jgi:hypothetical protein
MSFRAQEMSVARGWPSAWNFYRVAGCGASVTACQSWHLIGRVFQSRSRDASHVVIGSLRLRRRWLQVPVSAVPQ